MVTGQRTSQPTGQLKFSTSRSFTTEFQFLKCSFHTVFRNRDLNPEPLYNNFYYLKFTENFCIIIQHVQSKGTWSYCSPLVSIFIQQMANCQTDVSWLGIGTWIRLATNAWNGWKQEYINCISISSTACATTGHGRNALRKKSLGFYLFFRRWLILAPRVIVGRVNQHMLDNEIAISGWLGSAPAGNSSSQICHPKALPSFQSSCMKTVTPHVLICSRGPS